MTIRPGKAKGPSVAPPSSGGGGGGTYPPVTPQITPAWFLAGTFAHTAFQIAAVTRSILLYTLPIKGMLHGIIVLPVTQFAGTGMTDYQVSCGIAGDLQRYTSPLDVLNIVPAATFSQQIPLFNQENRTATVALQITATSNVNLSNSTAGNLSVYLLLSVTP